MRDLKYDTNEYLSSDCFSHVDTKDLMPNWVYKTNDNGDGNELPGNLIKLIRF